MSPTVAMTRDSPRRDGDRALKSLECGRENSCRYEEEKGAVEDSSKDLRAVVPERILRCRQPTCDKDGCKREKEGRGVNEHVPGV